MNEYDFKLFKVLLFKNYSKTIFDNDRIVIFYRKMKI